MTKNKKGWLAAGGPLAVVGSVFAQGKVTGVETQSVEGGSAVQVFGTNLPVPHLDWDNGAVIVRFAATLDGSGRTWYPRKGGVKAVSFGPSGGQVDVAIRPYTA